MACVGRTKQCTIVPSNHYGPVPGVPVGSQWKFRVQVSQLGPCSKWQPLRPKEEVVPLMVVGYNRLAIPLATFFFFHCNACHLVILCH